MKIISIIDDFEIIDKILKHLTPFVPAHSLMGWGWGWVHISVP